MKLGQWVYFFKKGKRGKAIGNVLGRGTLLGSSKGFYIIKESFVFYTPKIDEVVIVVHKSNVGLTKDEIIREKKKFTKAVRRFELVIEKKKAGSK